MSLFPEQDLSVNHQLPRSFSSSIWLAWGGLGSVTAPRGYSCGHSRAQHEEATIAAVRVPAVKPTPYLRLPIQSPAHPLKISPPWPLQYGPILYRTLEALPIPSVPMRPLIGVRAACNSPTRPRSLWCTVAL